MPPKRRALKAAIWAAATVLLLAMLYFGVYYRVVGKAYVVRPTVDPQGRMQVQRTSRAVYSLPWPLPSHFNQPWLLTKIQSWLEPAHQFDRRLRLDFWKDHPPVPLPATPPPNWFDQFERGSFEPDRLPSP